MQYLPLGKSALNISQVGFGCMSLKAGQDDVQQLIDRAIDNGINYFDTADLYDKGQNELMIGKALKQKRDKVIIATKVGNQWRSDGSGWDWNPSKTYILQAVEQSLVRLQTDYIDLYQLHGGTTEDPIDDIVEAFELLKLQGKIREYGISSIRPNVIREYVKRSHMVSVMMQYSLLDRRPEENCLQLLHEHDMAVLARGSLAGGLLVNKAAKPYLYHTEEQVAKAASMLHEMTVGRLPAASLAIQFVLQTPGITSAVVGIRTMQQLTDALEAVSARPFPTEELEKLRVAFSAKGYEDHR